MYKFQSTNELHWRLPVLLSLIDPINPTDLTDFVDNYSRKDEEIARYSKYEYVCCLGFHDKQQLTANVRL